MTRRTVLHPVQVFDFSLVDEEKARQKDPDAVIEVIKAEDVPTAQAIAQSPAADDERPAEPDYWEKAEFTADERKKLASSGAAMPDGSFPIRNKSDLHNAMQAIGRAKNPAAAKAHIRKRARALGLTDELTDAFKAEELTEAEKAGAELSGKNRGFLRGVLSMHDGVRHALAAFLGEEAKEPEHADVAAGLQAAARELDSGAGDDPREEQRGPTARDIGAPSGRTGPRGVQKAEEAGDVVEEDDMPTLDEIKGAFSELLGPLTQRLEAVETAQKAATVPVEKAQTPAPPVVVQQSQEEVIRDAIAVYEARKAGGIAQAQFAFGVPFPLLGTPGRETLREFAKAAPNKRPTFEEGLRILTGRDVLTGQIVRED